MSTGKPERHSSKALTSLSLPCRALGIEAEARVCYLARDTVHVSSFKEVRP